MRAGLRAVAPLALALSLAACGGVDADAPASAAGGSSTPTTSSSATPGTSSAPAAPQECPITATPGPAPTGISTDLTVKPLVPAHPAPPPAQVQVADVVVGTGEQIGTLDTVQVKYVGAFYTSGEEFDSSWSRGADETFPVTVCTRGTVAGFSIAPTGMRVGGRRVVTIPAEYGYGATGSPPKIAPDTPLVFVIDAVSVQQG